MQTIYIVERASSFDGLYLFERQCDAEAFMEAVGGEPVCSFGAAPLNGERETAALIAAEKEETE